MRVVIAVIRETFYYSINSVFRNVYGCPQGYLTAPLGVVKSNPFWAFNHTIFSTSPAHLDEFESTYLGLSPIGSLECLCEVETLELPKTLERIIS